MHILLIHGLGRTPLSLVGLARDLRQAGHQTESLAYSGALESYHRIVARVRARLEAASQRGPYAVVAHSLGGLIVRAALGGWPNQWPLPRHVIMLGTPNRMPRLAQRFHRWWPYRLINGQCGQLLAQPGFFADLPRPAVPITVIAGSRGWPRAVSLFEGDPNDGVVAVEEARLDSGSVLIELPVSHTFMMNSRQVRAAVRSILGNSRGAEALEKKQAVGDSW